MARNFGPFRSGRRALTKPSDADLTRFATISADDIEDATVQFRRDAPAGFRSLLDAKPDETSTELPKLGPES